MVLGIEYGSIFGANRKARLMVGIGGVTEINFIPQGNRKVYEVISKPATTGGEPGRVTIDEGRVNKVIYDD
jgi:hypothetical protein